MSNKTAVIFSQQTVKRQLCGIILSRIMSRGLLNMEAVGLFALSSDIAQKINSTLAGQIDFQVEDTATPVMICIFSGEDAVEKTSELVKDIEFSLGSKLIAAPADTCQAAQFMKIIADLPNTGNLLTPAPCSGEERTLLIIKPENFRQPSVRPGAIIDILMQLDLKWVGCKLHRMSIDEALEFYAPVQQALRKKLGPKTGAKAIEMLTEELQINFNNTVAAELAELAGNAFADSQFEDIIEFMAGKRPGEVSVADRSNPAGAKCMVLIFDGVDAVAKIRKVLGPTNPAEAAGGTVRYDFGTNIMVNAAHASDSQESYLRESAIVKVNKNDLCKIAAQYQ